MWRIRNRGRSKGGGENRNQSGGRSPRTGLIYVMTTVRITASINKAEYQVPLSSYSILTTGRPRCHGRRSNVSVDLA